MTRSLKSTINRIIQSLAHFFWNHFYLTKTKCFFFISLLTSKTTSLEQRASSSLTQLLVSLRVMNPQPFNPHFPHPQKIQTLWNSIKITIPIALQSLHLFTLSCWQKSFLLWSVFLPSSPLHGSAPNIQQLFHEPNNITWTFKLIIDSVCKVKKDHGT